MSNATSFSDLLCYQRCPKQFEYSRVRQLQKIKRSVALSKGTIVHRLLMAYYLGGEEAMWNEYSEIGWEAEGWLLEDGSDPTELVVAASDLVDRYLTYYQDDWEILYVEETFEVEVDGELISFTPDLIVRERETGAVWVVDHKTAATIPTEPSIGNLQSVLYYGLLKPFIPGLVGFMFNFLRKKEPTQPRLTKTGDKRVADLNRIDTTYEILRDYLAEEAPDLLDDPAHKQRLAELRETNRFFGRQYLYIPDAMVQSTLEDVGLTIEQIQAAKYPRHFMSSGMTSCDRCEFSALCVAELRGYDTKEVLMMYEDRDMSHKDYDHEVEDLSA